MTQGGIEKGKHDIMYIVDRRPYLLNSEWKAILRGHLLKQQKLICPADKGSADEIGYFTCRWNPTLGERRG